MQPWWKEVLELVHLLAYITKGCDPDGVELFFLSSLKQQMFKSATKLYRTVREHPARASTSLYECFENDLRNYARKIEQAYQQSQKASIFARTRQLPRKRSIYVLTDGILESGEDAQGQDGIKFLINKLTEASLPRDQIGIQFISFGNDAQGLARLRKLERMQQEYGLAL